MIPRALDKEPPWWTAWWEVKQQTQSEPPTADMWDVHLIPDTRREYTPPCHRLVIQPVIQPSQQPSAALRLSDCGRIKRLANSPSSSIATQRSPLVVEEDPLLPVLMPPRSGVTTTGPPRASPSLLAVDVIMHVSTTQLARCGSWSLRHYSNPARPTPGVTLRCHVPPPFRQAGERCQAGRYWSMASMISLRHNSYEWQISRMAAPSNVDSVPVFENNKLLRAPGVSTASKLCVPVLEIIIATNWLRVQYGPFPPSQYGTLILLIILSM